MQAVKTLASLLIWPKLLESLLLDNVISARISCASSITDLANFKLNRISHSYQMDQFKVSKGSKIRNRYN